MMRGFPGKSHSRGDGGGGGVAGAEGTPDLYGKSSPVHRIGKVPTAASTNNWLIHFYSPESSRSQRLVGVMEALSRGLGALDIKVGAVNCDKKKTACKEAKRQGALPVGFWIRGQLITLDKDDLSLPAIRKAVTAALGQA